MKNRRITKMSMSALVLLISSLLGTAQAAEILVDSSILDEAMDVVAEKYSDSAEAQNEITRLANSASSTFEEFKRANDNLESLLVLNAGYRRQIAAQEQQLETLM
jgi:archaellum component FlaG (FlaF/FlaG flagellin family)